MSTAANDNIDYDVIRTFRDYGGTYDTTYVTWRYDNIATIRRPVVAGGTAAPGPGIGYGQIFPIRQEL